MADNKYLDYIGLVHLKSKLDKRYARVKLNEEVQSLVLRIEALEKLHAGGNEVAPVNPPVPDRPIDNSDYPIITNPVEFYTFTTEQGIKLQSLINESRGNLSKVNNVLLKTKLGQELGIKGITSLETFYSGKASQITADAYKTIYVTPYNVQSQEYLKEVGY